MLIFVVTFFTKPNIDQKQSNISDETIGKRLLQLLKMRIEEC